jgi:pimeloyl-ACP methyl ester carboxylesterase
VTPFQQQPLSALPESPHRPHVFADSQAESATMRSAYFGPHKVHWRTYGEGPPLLLVHGLMTHSYSWRYAFATLGQRFTCYAPDLVGAGDSHPVDRPYHPDALADWIGEFVAMAGIKGCPAVGNSMGGYLCMRLALREPETMSRLVNLHAPGLSTPRMRVLNAAMSIPGSYGLLGRLVSRDPERWAHSNVHYYDESLKSREEARAYAAPLSSPEGCRAFARYLHQALAPQPMDTFSKRLRRAGFPIPLQLLYAEEDPMVPPSVGLRYKALLPSAELTWLHEASHFAHVDAVEQFTAAALPFLEA